MIKTELTIFKTSFFNITIATFHIQYVFFLSFLFFFVCLFVLFCGYVNICTDVEYDETALGFLSNARLCQHTGMNSVNCDAVSSLFLYLAFQMQTEYFKTADSLWCKIVVQMRSFLFFLTTYHILRSLLQHNIHLFKLCNVDVDAEQCCVVIL